MPFYLDDWPFRQNEIEKKDKKNMLLLSCNEKISLWDCSLEHSILTPQFLNGHHVVAVLLLLYILYVEDMY